MTNADRTAFSAYSEVLGNPFHDSVTCDDAGCAKPNPQFFAFNKGRQSAFGTKQSEVLHVAQSQHHDIGGAVELGYTTCWIERRQGQAGFGATPKPKAMTKPHFHFAALGQLADAVDAELGVSA
jgi:putative hydrolase of the HAD superfamily